MYSLVHSGFSRSVRLVLKALTTIYRGAHRFYGEFALLGGKFPALAGFECNVIFLLIFRNKRLRVYIVVITGPSGIHKWRPGCATG